MSAKWLACVVVIATSCMRDPVCLRDADCGTDRACIRGSCESLARACTSDAACTPPDLCNSGACLRPGRCLFDSHCRADEVCIGGLCLPTRCSDGDCPPGSTCEPGRGTCRPDPCAADTDCPPPLVCDPALRQCRAIGQVPLPERCDDVDNDLDDTIDEGFDVGEPCAVGLGACEREGVMICAGDAQASLCDAVAGAPAPEQCNVRDDDCDDEVDEDFPELGAPCIAGLGACAAGVHACLATGAGTYCMPLGSPTAEACNALDDDCDGEVDDDFPGLGLSCVSGLGACRVVGLLSCSADGSSSYCAAPVPAPQPQPEICDGVDNDCDGSIDEGLGCLHPRYEGQAGFIHATAR